MSSLDHLQEAVQGSLDPEHDPLTRVQALVTTHVTTTLDDLALHATMLLELRAGPAASHQGDRAPGRTRRWCAR